jgi:hypothetical protein
VTVVDGRRTTTHARRPAGALKSNWPTSKNRDVKY